MDFRLIAAIDVAKKAHAGQVRKFTGEPYITHPFAVGGLVVSVTQDDDMLIAAILHDVVEDSPVTLQTIYGIFGSRVAAMVGDLTDVSTKADGNREVRKALDRAHTAQSSPDAKTIKLADLIDNTKSIAAFDKGFAVKYMAEKKLLLEVLTEGDPTLYKIANDLVIRYYEGNLC